MGNHSVSDAIAELFGRAGGVQYFGEEVTQAQHMLQAASLAESSGADPSLLVATLLHDVGHLLNARSGGDPIGRIDLGHEESGAAWLSRWFGEAVTEPVRLHVAAKRYLCVADPAYRSTLSAASLHSLELQGGPMEFEEAHDFESARYASEAVALRRWDELAKERDAPEIAFVRFLPLLSSTVAQ